MTLTGESCVILPRQALRTHSPNEDPTINIRLVQPICDLLFHVFFCLKKIERIG